jgi:hypothetical protein
MTHMAPEVMLHGRISKAADVYAFGMVSSGTTDGCAGQRAVCLWQQQQQQLSCTVLQPSPIPHVPLVQGCLHDCTKQVGPACCTHPLCPPQVLWEVYTGGHVFKGVPRALLGHQVTTAHKRPEWPPGTPPGYSSLAAACWDASAAKR